MKGGWKMAMRYRTRQEWKGRLLYRFHTFHHPAAGKPSLLFKAELRTCCAAAAGSVTQASAPVHREAISIDRSAVTIHGQSAVNSNKPSVRRICIKRLKTLCCLLVFGSAALLSGCGNGTTEKVKRIRIGVALYDQYDTFIGQMMDAFTGYASRQEETSKIVINLEILDASGSQTTQNEQVKTLVEKGCDVVCVNLVDRTEPTTITDLAEKRNVPVIFFNRELVAEDLERWDKLFYVGADAFESGILQGEIVADLFESSPNRLDKNGDGVIQYIVLEGETGHQDSIVRTEYSVNTIMNRNIPMEKLGYAIANWNRAQAQTQTASMMLQYEGRIELILANNDDMALGAIDALKAGGAEKSTWPVIVGIDGTHEGLQAVKNREMYGTVYNDKEGQAQNMLKLAFALATGGSLEEIPLQNGKYIRLPYSRITRENVSDYK